MVNFKSAVINECLDVLRRDDVKDEIKSGSITARGFKKEMNDGL